jgi:hypothetical protein
MDVSILKHKTQCYWLFLIIDHSRPGTHPRYNVVYNSNCSGEKYKTFKEASNKADEILLNYERRKQFDNVG